MEGTKERISCYECGAGYSLNLAKLPETTEFFKCLKCGKPVPILRRLLKEKPQEDSGTQEEKRTRPPVESLPATAFDPYADESWDHSSSEDDTEQGNWLATLADMFSILLIFFILMFAISAVDRKKFETVMQSINKALGGNIIFSREPVGPVVPIVPPPSVLDQLRSSVQVERQLLSVLREQLEGFIAEQQLQGKFSLVEDNDALVVIAQDMLMFDSGSAEIREEVRSHLAKLAIILKQIKNEIVVEGHTDDVPIRTSRFSSNWDLSVMRATRVIDYFIEECGLNPARLSAAGYAYFRPRYNLASEDRGKNRRIEVLIKKKYSDEFIDEIMNPIRTAP